MIFFILLSSNGLLGMEPAPSKRYIMDLDPSGHIKYGTWSYMKDYEGKKLPLRDILNFPNGKKIASLHPGESFTAIKGEQHVVPTKLEVSKPFDENGLKFSPGDNVILLGYTGEGSFLAWKDGNKLEVDGAIIDDKTGVLKNFTSPCLPQKCRLSLATEGYKITEWINIQTSKKIVGWVEGNRFFNMPN